VEEGKMVYDYSNTLEHGKRLLAEAEQSGAYVLFSETALGHFSGLMFLRDDEDDENYRAFDTLDNAVDDFLAKQARRLKIEWNILRQAWLALLREKHRLEIIGPWKSE
jgi:hypothetical protein